MGSPDNCILAASSLDSRFVLTRRPSFVLEVVVVVVVFFLDEVFAGGFAASFADDDFFSFPVILPTNFINFAEPVVLCEPAVAAVRLE